jgi:hypothetical protein
VAEPTDRMSVFAVHAASVRMCAPAATANKTPAATANKNTLSDRKQNTRSAFFALVVLP